MYLLQDFNSSSLCYVVVITILFQITHSRIVQGDKMTVHSKTSANWAVDEDISRLLKSLPSWQSLINQTPMTGEMTPSGFLNLNESERVNFFILQFFLFFEETTCLNKSKRKYGRKKRKFIRNAKLFGKFLFSLWDKVPVKTRKYG